MKIVMQTEAPEEVDSTLNSVRRRGQTYVGYLLWIFMLLGLLWAANLVVALINQAIEVLRNIRSAAGFIAPASGPDIWVLGGITALLIVAGTLILLAYAGYRASWNRRLAFTWGTRPRTIHSRLKRLPAVADERTLKRRSEYLGTLLSSPGWSHSTVRSNSLQDRTEYLIAAEKVLREIEVDIARRAVTAGLVVGLNRNAFIDTVTIVASALELQLHVLTRLGKRPTPRIWVELTRRALASIFLNTYVTREDALYLNLLIRKAALGLEVASDAVQNTLADVDLDEIIGHTTIPGLSELTHVASLGVSVGASGLRYIGNFIEHTANDLLQGVMAGGILYYHGMALAAECLALDEQHRRSPEMTRTISQAMTVACTPAGRLLRDQVRKMREFLRERRRQVLSVAKDNVSGAADKVRETVRGFSDFATSLFRNP